ncbi:MAG: hypothetical protein GC136_01500 [Alphaproteobacteria bacterium]|nr:hypothetical protein [Alphaproteobacteria bacterium]
MPFEDEIAELNQAYFFREFTYSNTNFRTRNEDDVEVELELADSLLSIEDSAVIFQLKEREVQGDSTLERERTWFENKVLRKGTKQVRDTLRYLESEEEITLKNHREHEITLRGSSIANLYKLVVFQGRPELPDELAKKKYHESNTAGVVHIIAAEDYKGIISTLLTPAEFMDYLSYREDLIDLWGEHLNTLPEQALVGHYIMIGNVEEKPELRHSYALAMIDHRAEEWDISVVIRLFADRIIDAESPTGYYPIISTLAQLNRGDLRQFKQRYSLSIDAVRANNQELPYRMAIPRLNCGFIFIPLTLEEIPHQGELIRALTEAHKYDQRLEKCIGITFSVVEGGGYDVGWCVINCPWEQDDELANFIASNRLFREVRTVEENHYTFNENVVVRRVGGDEQD